MQTNTSVNKIKKHEYFMVYILRWNKACFSAKQHYYTHTFESISVTCNTAMLHYCIFHIVLETLSNTNAICFTIITAHVSQLIMQTS